jgi:hypothetical protein
MDKEPPRFWIAFGILCITFALCFVMLVYNSVQAHAQEQPLCAPAEILLRQFAEIHQEKPIWEGVVPRDGKPIEGSVSGPIACIVASGRDGASIETGKGV